MILHRLYMEDKNQAEILAMLRTYFDAYTLLSAQGIWKGTVENTLVIEIISDEAPAIADMKLRAIAEMIKQVNKQDCILYTRQAVESELI